MVYPFPVVSIEKLAFIHPPLIAQLQARLRYIPIVLYAPWLTRQSQKNSCSHAVATFKDIIIKHAITGHHQQRETVSLMQG